MAEQFAALTDIEKSDLADAAIVVFMSITGLEFNDAVIAYRQDPRFVGETIANALERKEVA